MALILLLPGEVFSHAHDVVSTSSAVAGNVELTVEGETFVLTPTTVLIPAGAVHVLHNVGDTVAQIACGGYGMGD
jgi:quercetin dioxygenase-like cupin family protein